MARIWIEGFEAGIGLYSGQEVWATPPWTIISGASYCRSASSYFTGPSSYCMEFQSPAGAYRSFGSAKSEVYVSMKVYTATSGTVAVIGGFKDSAGTTIGTVIKNASDQIVIYRGAYSGGSVISTSTLTKGNGAFLFECWYKPLNSNGRWTIKIDGVAFNTVDTDVDTTAGLEDVQYLVLGTPSTSGGQSVYIDDVVVDDSGWVGNSYIQTVKPTGVGDSAAVWTASTGNCWSCVDEVAFSDTDYIYTNAAGNVDTYNCNDLTGTVGSVKSVRVLMRYAYEGTPTPTKQKIAIKSGGNYYYGSDLTPSLSFKYSEKMWEVNPADSAAWEDADITDLEIGVASVA